MQDYNLVLASASPRRRDILRSSGFDFVVIPSTFKEKLSDLNFSYKKIENLAYQKAKNVYDSHKDLPSNTKILSADTVVVLDNKILGKPKDKNNAYDMLKSLSGRTHFVVTSICVLDVKTGTEQIKSTTSYVTFNELSDENIEHYINEYKPFDKAGAYGIQELPASFIKNIKGCYENIVGLSSKTVKNML